MVEFFKRSRSSGFDVRKPLANRTKCVLSLFVSLVFDFPMNEIFVKCEVGSAV